MPWLGYLAAGLSQRFRDRLARLAELCPEPYHVGDLPVSSGMPELFDRLKASLADRYAIERELGRGAAWPRSIRT